MLSVYRTELTLFLAAKPTVSFNSSFQLQNLQLQIPRTQIFVSAPMNDKVPINVPGVIWNLRGKPPQPVIGTETEVQVQNSASSYLQECHKEQTVQL